MSYPSVPQSGTSYNGVINLAKKASPKVVERFKIGSCTEGLFSQDYDWTGVATVQVRSIDNLTLQNYDPTKVDGSSRFGYMEEVGDTVQEMTVQDDKSFFGSIDKRNYNETLQTKAASRILKRETDEVLIPYADKYRLDKLANNAGTKAPVVVANVWTSAKIVETLMTANAAMSEELVPDTGRVLYMSYTEAIKLKLASQVIGIDKLGEQSIVNGVMGKVDKCQVRLVPDAYMPNVTVGNATHKALFMIVKTGCALAPKKIETFRVINNSHLVDGALVQGRMLHDCFVLTTKNKGIYVGYNSVANT